MSSPSSATAVVLDPLRPSPDTIPALSRAEAARLPAWDLTPHQLCDLELLGNGGFAPLTGYLNPADYASVLAHARLASGELWPIPVTLDVSESFGSDLEIGQRIALRHPEGMPLAVLTVESVYRPDKEAEARAVLGTTDVAHPWVRHLRDAVGPVYVGGAIELVELPAHHVFRRHRHTPAELRTQFAERGWKTVVAFQTRNPLHRAHVELVRRAAEQSGADGILLQPVVGRTRPGDVDEFTRVRCYDAVLPHFAPKPALLSLLPLAMRMAGPREALWHALIRKNYGATHFIVGRDHASAGNDSNGRPFHGPYEAQELVARHATEIGIQVLPFEELVYLASADLYVTRSEVPGNAEVAALSGTELRRRLRDGIELPSWFTYPAIERELRKRHKSRAEQGFVVFFTGLSGAGKSTIANIVLALLEERGPRQVTLLDGDLVRKHLSSELGFSREHRDLNVTRIGFVAAEIARHGGAAICAPIAPYAAARRVVRETVGEAGGFIEVHLSTPLEICEERDRKGLYAKARAGLLKGFTGIDDPYEAPAAPEIRIDTARATAEEAAQRIVAHLEKEGFLGPAI
jgi:sulfate adenylyltransferase